MHSAVGSAPVAGRILVVTAGQHQEDARIDIDLPLLAYFDDKLANTTNTPPRSQLPFFQNLQITIMSIFGKP